MSNGSVHVTVDSRAVAAEVSRLKSDINHVANEVRGVSNNIHILQAELLAQMAITIDRINAVRNEVSRSIEAAAQAKIVESASEIFGKVGIITSSAKRIGQQYHKSVIRCGRISDKFDRLNEEVKVSYHTDIQRLGKYIFNLWDNHYQRVEDHIQKQHTGFLTTIKRSVEQIRKYREKKLDELFKGVKEKLAHFLEQRKNFHNSISMITARKLNVPVDKIAIPMITVKKTGTAFTQIKIGHEVVPETNKHIGYCLQETDIFKTYRSDHSNLDRYIRWRDMTHEELKQLEHNLEQLLKKKHISREYYELLVQGLKKSPPKVPEQFELPQTGDTLSEVICPPVEKIESQQVEIKLEEEALMEDEIEDELEAVEEVEDFEEGDEVVDDEYDYEEDDEDRR
jgi:hypothetical protein